MPALGLAGLGGDCQNPGQRDTLARWDTLYERPEGNRKKLQMPNPTVSVHTGVFPTLKLLPFLFRLLQR